MPVRLTILLCTSKSKFNLKSDRVNLVAPASPYECLLFYPMSGRYSTNWVDPARKFKYTTAARELELEHFIRMENTLVLRDFFR